MYAATSPGGSGAVKARAGPCQGPVGEHAQYDDTVDRPSAPAAMVKSTYVPPCRTTENALPTPVRRSSPRTAPGRAPAAHAEPVQYCQAAGSARAPSGTLATNAEEVGREAACPSFPPNT
ncbi:hypothetical protein RKD49_006605 [Streptomyces glaucescens]